MTTITTPKVVADVDASGDRITGRFTVKNLPTVTDASKPLFAAVGVADLALEQVKEVPALYVAEVKKATSRIAEVPTQVKGLRGDVEARVEKITEAANDFYAKVAIRGERLITQIRKQPATEAALEEGKEAVRKAEAAAKAARRAVKAGEKAVEGAASKLG